MLRLSTVYDRRTFWVLVYHVQPGSSTVELITNKFFNSKKKAMKWFNNKRVPSAYIQPEAVEVSGLGSLLLGESSKVPAEL